MNNLLGQRFGRLAATLRGTDAKGRTVYRCLCDCGNVTVVRDSDLASGHTQSRGCLKLERAHEANTTHGARHTPEYRAFYAAKDRCTNPRRNNYPHYGGRGIRFLFASFEQWFAELGRRPTPQH